MTPSESSRIASAEQALGYHFERPGLLLQALTHASVKSDTRPDYERLEFLGDAVLELVISEHIFALQEGQDEGAMTRLRSAVVSAPTLARSARDLGLDAFLEIGRGLKEGVTDAMCADLFEATAGAIHLDGGLDAARQFLLPTLAGALSEALSGSGPRNWKSQLQHLCQKHRGSTPRYDLEGTRGPDHAPSFSVFVSIADEPYGQGYGSTKKAAEQAAAEAALRRLEPELAEAEAEPKLAEQAPIQPAPEDASPRSPHPGAP